MLAYKHTVEQFKCHPRSPLLLCSVRDGDQHCSDRDSSGDMRKSGYDVDHAGDASNAEIGHVAYLSSRTSIAIKQVCDLAESGASSGTAAKDSRGSQTGHR
jgi:hypothetical protein